MTSIPYLPPLTDVVTEIALSVMPIIAGVVVIGGGAALILWGGAKIVSWLASWEAARNAKPAQEQ